MNSSARAVLDVLSQPQLDFIEQELGYAVEDIEAMSDDEIDQMYDRIADIEVDETADADREGRDLTDRGKLAESIVTVIGDELYRPDDEPELGDEE